MGGLVLIYSFLLLMLVFCCNSMQLNYPLNGGLQGNETDRLALLAIKAQIVQLDPSNHKGILSSWNDSIHFCSWGGVSCSPRHHQRVTVLNLSSQGLAGSISPHIGNLSFLRLLGLFNNSFTHQIPPQIGRLRRLQRLSLVNNSFVGHIPANLSNCLNLLFLALGNNKLVGEIPSEIGSLPKLEALVLHSNNLSGKIPPSLGNLSSLEVFYILDNKFVGSIPSSLGQLRKLTFFQVSQNRLSGTIPPSIYNLSGIATFELQGNHIQGSIPSNLGDAFRNLEYFDISDNEFIGVIPLSLSNATNLSKVSLALNFLKGKVPSLQKLHKRRYFGIGANNLGSGKEGDLSFLSDLTNATDLRYLPLGYNHFGGILPTSISNLSTSLSHLWLSSNQLHGSIPTRIGNLVNLESLSLEENSFSGGIPTEIGKLSGLRDLYLSNNQLAGNIQFSFGNLTMLTNLYLDGNNLNGSIPYSLGECQWLLELSLSQNHFGGTIPQQLPIALVTLILSGNNLSGFIPSEIGNLRSLGVLEAADNKLSGNLPSSLGDCQILEVLHLQGNFFDGLIPSSMEGLRGLRELDLSRNNLSGDIPRFLQGFRNVQNMNLSFNNFWGQVPVEGVFKNASAFSVVGNTRLCGGIASLKLPVCTFKESKRGGLSRKMKFTIFLVCGFVLSGIAILLTFLHRSKKRKIVEVSNLGNSALLQVSYATLLRATNGFSATNLAGVGAFGSVFKGILDNDKVVAVKVFNMLHIGASKSFITECEAFRNIKHRNLIKILSVCSSIDFNGNDFKALVYEFMDKGSLEEWLHPSSGNQEVVEEPKTLSLIQRLDIAMDVAYALDYLHNDCETPIVHCDIKPSNVLLDTDLTGHVSDFGISRFLSKQTSNVSGTESISIGIRGSVGYAAPEYGMGSEVSTYGDVYSFGILLLELFTGKRPTDHIFNDGMNLHNYVKAAIPRRVSEITDPVLRQETTTNVVEAHHQPSVRAQKVNECLTLIFSIGIACSGESPTSRKEIGHVVTELHSIRNNLLC